jgi:spermidine synthase
MPLIFIVGAAFVLTGLGALVVEQAFEKLLTTVIGASVDAGAIVLGIYFFGMSLGAVAFHKLRQRASSGIALYAGLEAFIGVWAVLLGFFFAEVQSISAMAIQFTGGDPRHLFFARVAVAAAWIIPPTFAMGASFPAMVSWLRSQGGDLERRASMFYTLNIVGALLGASGAAYLLFPGMGLKNALIAVGCLEVATAGSVYWIARRPTDAGEALAPVSVPEVFRSAAARRPLVAAFMSGFVVFSFEVLWLHLGGVTIGMSAYAFAGVLTTVLAGLFVGGAIAASIKGEPHVLLARFMVLAALGVVAVYPLWDDIPERILEMQSFATGFWSGEAVRLLLMVSVVGVPSVGLGLIYPTILRIPVGGVSRDAVVAAFGLANGVGSIAGSFLVGFVLLRGIGSEETYRLLTATIIVALAISCGVRSVWKELTVGLVLLTALTNFDLWDRISLTSGTNVYFRPGFVSADSELVFWHEDNTGGITTVAKGPFGFRTLLTNGKFQGNDSGEMVDQASIALIPVALAPGRDRALVIGLGTGQSAKVVADAGFKSVEVAEIAEGMIEASRYFSSSNGDVLQRPDVHLRIGDGRNLLLREGGSFDLISMEISSIWFAGAANLYSEEFYRLASTRLSPGGIFQQWIQLHHIGDEDLVSALATVRAVFPFVSLYVVGSQGIIIATGEMPTFDVARLDRPSLAAERSLLDRVGVGMASLADTKMLDEETLGMILEHARRVGVKTNTDGNRHLEFSTPRYNLESGDRLLSNLNWFYTFVGTPERQAQVEKVRNRIYPAR